MASTLPMQFQNILVYNNDEFLGYVSSVSGLGTSITCKIVKKKWRFPLRRATSVFRSAKNSTICLTDSGEKFYPRKDKITFKMIEETS